VAYPTSGPADDTVDPSGSQFARQENRRQTHAGCSREARKLAKLAGAGTRSYSLGADFVVGVTASWGKGGYGASANPSFESCIVAEDGSAELEDGFA